jgi:hypothetical protein
MSGNKTVLSALLAGIILSAALAENATAQVPIRTRRSTASGPTSRPPRVEPCWEVAGVPKSAVPQRRVIAQQARHEVEAVRELIALDAAEAATDPADSSAGAAGDRCHNHTGTAGGYAVLSGTASRRSRQRTCWERARRTVRRDVGWAQAPSDGGGRNASERDASAQLNLSAA